ncbi:hypothetical protein ACTPOK_10400 [Streptomyces inhibens]|uniref:hypothetical protein n=1 Tax=Streptomyces inhibens TaxID=2293571 RepID=UPI00402A9463
MTYQPCLAPRRRRRSVHDPGEILLDVALTVAPDVDCLSDAFALIRWRVECRLLN